MSTVNIKLLRKYNVPGPRYTSYPTVPYWDTTPNETQWIGRVANAVNTEDDKSGASLYVHIPFCRALCTFCGCNMRVTRNRGLISPYVDAVLKEYSLYLERLGRDQLTFGEIHLGGGTPTYLNAAELDSMMKSLLARATVLPGASLSLEVDPRVTNRAQLEVLGSHGFNRISLGVQDFDPKVQDIVNRVQSEQQVCEVVETSRALGFTSVNFDLIYGLPLQTLDSIKATMEAVVRLRPDRIAFYSYAHVPWIKPSQRRFTELDLPEGNAKRALYELGREMLEAAGYSEIGMDHFALTSDQLFRAATTGALHRNFMGYTPAFTRPLLGLGVSAISDSGDAFIQNEKNLQQYEERVMKGELPIQRGHLLSEEDVVIRSHILNLMTRFETHWNASDGYTPFLDGVIDRLRELNADHLVETAAHQVRVTDIGRAFLRNVCMAFDARLIRKTPATQLFSQTV
ncbi:MAG: oxygen-independent coproporphyrinogen III oxidase [Steroidobacteraceae bacterium]